VHADHEIGIYSLDSQITITDDILVTGFVNAESSYKPVRLQVYDPNGDLLYRPDVYFNGDGQFSWLFHPPLGKFEKTGTYSIVASHEEISETAEIHFTVKDEADDSSVINPMTNSPKENANPNTSESSDQNTLDVQQNPNKSIQISNESKSIVESPIFSAVVAIVIIGIIVGVVMWMRNTYEKPLSQ